MLKIILILISLFSQNVLADLSYGDGSEDCIWNSSTNLTQRVFNCESVQLSVGHTLSFNGASDYIIIRSQGDVNILGTIDISATGVTAGPGGSESGVSKLGGHGLSGGTAVDGGGGGGSGGRFGAASLPTAGTNGTGGTPGVGASIPSTSYYPEDNFEENFTGGSAGGQGGQGFDTSDFEAAGVGGGGAGGLIIIAKGQVSISGAILANGGVGEDGAATGTGTSGGGAGGGGSGGAVYIIGSQVSLSGTISAVGGSGGLGGSLVEDGGDGGNGGSGRVRIDSLGGSYSGVATNPVAYQSTLPKVIDPLESSIAPLTSDIEQSCVYKEQNNLEFLFSFIIGPIMGLVLLRIPMVFRRRRYGLY